MRFRIAVPGRDHISRAESDVKNTIGETRKMVRRNLRGVLFFLGLVLFFPATAFAYLDPGTGSMIVQGILAAVAAVGVSAGIFWKKLKGLFGGHKDAGEGKGEDEV